MNDSGGQRDLVDMRPESLPEWDLRHDDTRAAVLYELGNGGVHLDMRRCDPAKLQQEIIVVRKTVHRELQSGLVWARRITQDAKRGGPDWRTG